MVSGDGRTTTYTAFDKPDRIAKGGNIAVFSYGPDRKRYKRVDETVADGVKTTLYAAGKAFERIQDSNGTVMKHYVGDFAVITHTIDNNGGTNRTSYLHRDHLGSVDTITDEAGAVEQRMSFDSWGKRREITWQAMPDTSITTFNTDITTRGFTGHEMIDAVGLVHMNGRVYEPELGRFLSADPIVEAIDNLQTYNRYSYVRNNPLTLTDPSGFQSNSESDNSVASITDGGDADGAEEGKSTGEVDTKEGSTIQGTPKGDGDKTNTREGSQKTATIARETTILGRFQSAANWGFKGANVGTRFGGLLGALGLGGLAALAGYAEPEITEVADQVADFLGELFSEKPDENEVNQGTGENNTTTGTPEDPGDDNQKPDHNAGKSAKQYGHARNRHGSQRKAQALKDRAAAKNTNQGHFSDNRLIEEAFAKAPKEQGTYNVTVSKFSNVYTPQGGTLTTNNVTVVIGRRGPTTAYPSIP